MENLKMLKAGISIVFMICICYQTIFIIAKLFVKATGKRKKFTALKLCRYAVVISARNEQAVIGNLIDSIKNQSYPSNLVHIYVVADNCTDSTADVAREKGAFVYERFNTEYVGKGYALTYLFNIIKTEHKDEHYDGYFIFDADNLLEKNYIEEMNKTFSHGYDAVTSYRNTKNYGDNWISACYGTWFLQEAEFRNHPRVNFGSCSFLSGTGFLFSNEILEENGGWNYHLMTEDFEFTADLIIKGKDIGYCHDAIFYDEQPTDFKMSIIQRSRWIKGSTQVYCKYGLSLVKSFIKDGSFSAYDMIMNSVPVFMCSTITIIIEAIMLLFSFISPDYKFIPAIMGLIGGAFQSYGFLYLIGALTVITEWKRIKCPPLKKIIYSFMFPIFTYSFALSGIKSVFGTVHWVPIKHTSVLSISDVNSAAITKEKTK